MIFGNRCVASPVTADSQHLRLGELGLAALFSAHDISTASVVHIGHVFFLRAKVQMIDVDAGAVVAAVIDLQPLGDGASFENPCSPVSLLKETA